MKAENKKILDECRQYGLMINQGLKPHGISYHQRLELERIIGEEFQPGYSANRECEPCIEGMIKLAYYYYDNYEATQH